MRRTTAPERSCASSGCGVARYKAKLVTFNGRGFDLPLLELAAFRYGCSARDHFPNSRNRFNGNHIDLFDWLTNYGACRLAGGLNLLAKLLGKPGKMEVAGDQVYAMHRAGQLQEINDYCMFDTLDTYFVFLRTRVLLGELPLSEEAALARRPRLADGQGGGVPRPAPVPRPLQRVGPRLTCEAHLRLMVRSAHSLSVSTTSCICHSARVFRIRLARWRGPSR